MDASRTLGFGANAAAGMGMTPIVPWQAPPLSHPLSLSHRDPTHRPSTNLTPPKTPISLLQEACLRNSITPAYELISTEGQVHEPTFMYRVTVETRQGQGAGKSKKVAKHLAAAAVLEQLVREGVWGSWGLPGRTPAEAEAYVTALVSALGKEERPTGEAMVGEGNVVGKLQDRCNQLKWPVPEYLLEETAGQPHERLFRVCVSIGKLSAKSEAKSKKAAKRQAAELMLAQIATLKAQEGLDEDDLIDEETEPGAAYPKELEAQLELSACVPLSQCSVVEEEPEDPGPSLPSLPQGLDELLRCDLNSLSLSPDTVDWLRNLTMSPDDPSDPISFHPLRNLSVTGQVQCLVQLSTVPVAVCHGTGPNEKEAQYSAAKNALEYLKIMAAKAHTK